MADVAGMDTEERARVEGGNAMEEWSVKLTMATTSIGRVAV